jgi:hypothetical protein
VNERMKINKEEIRKGNWAKKEKEVKLKIVIGNLLRGCLPTLRHSGCEESSSRRLWDGAVQLLSKNGLLQVQP